MASKKRKPSSTPAGFRKTNVRVNGKTAYVKSTRRKAKKKPSAA